MASGQTATGRPAPTEQRATTLRVESIEVDEEGTALHVQPGGRPATVRVDATPNLAAAKKLTATARSIDRVIVTIDEETYRCAVTGRRRLPFNRSVPASLALGLGLLGVTVQVRGTRLPW